MIIPIIGICLLITWLVTDDVMVKLLCAFIFITILVPMAGNLISLVVNKAFLPKKDVVEPCKDVKVNPSPYYLQFRAQITKASKVLKREEVLQLKREVDNRLGDHAKVYKTFTFKNDYHEIYTKAKSSVLKDQDYIYLIEKLGGMTNEK